MGLLSCSAACGILVSQPGIEPVSPVLQGGFLTIGPPEKSLLNRDDLPHVLPRRLSGKEPACPNRTRAHALSREDLLEKEMATHSSILAWKIPWMEELRRLLSRGLQRDGYHLATKPPP